MAEVRFWRPADLPALLQMAERTAWEITPADDRAATTYETVARNARRNVLSILHAPFGTAVVADANGQIAGYLLIAVQQHDKTGTPQGYMADIYVAPAFRGKGLSGALHQLGEAYLLAIGIDQATNWTHAHNAAGQGASRHLGFDLWGMMLVKELRPSGAGL